MGDVVIARRRKNYGASVYRSAYRIISVHGKQRRRAESRNVGTGARIVTCHNGGNTGYRVRTPEATMEMRGTDHDIAHVTPQFTLVGDAAPGSYGKTYAGEAIISNASGTLTLREGQVAFAPLRVRASPRLLTAEPWFFSMHSFIDRRAAAVGDTLSGPNVQ